MDRTGPGTLLAGRYRLSEQVGSDTVTTLWRAEDLTLERPVAVRVLDASHARVQTTLDAARRAALVDDTRLQRVYGVGVEAGSGYVVLEWVTGQDAAVLAGKVSEQEALRIAVEATEALRTAASRQLHHGRLGPRQVVRASDGRVRVLGAGIDVAASGQPTPAAAARPEHRDVRDLCAVLYVLLTGLWPFGVTEGLLAAPTEKGRPVGPRTLRPDVSVPLDALVSEVLAGTGPDTLDGLVRRLHAVRDGVAVAGLGTVGGVAPAGTASRPPADVGDTDVLTPVPAAGLGGGAGAGAGAGAAGAVSGPGAPAGAGASAAGAPAAGAPAAGAPAAGVAGGAATGAGAAAPSAGAGAGAGLAAPGAGAGASGAGAAAAGAAGVLGALGAAGAAAGAAGLGRPAGQQAPPPAGRAAGPSAGDDDPRPTGPRRRVGSDPVVGPGPAATGTAAGVAGGVAAGAAGATVAGAVAGAASGPAAGSGRSPGATARAADPGIPVRTAGPRTQGATGYVAPTPAYQDEDDGWDLLPGGDQDWDEQGWDAAQPWDDERQPWDDEPWDGDDDPAAAGAVLPGGRSGGRRPAGAGAGVAVVLVMGAFVVGTLVWALDRVQSTDDAASPAPEVTVTVPPSAAPSAAPAPPPPPVDAPSLISPAGVQAIDPQGDGEENDQEAPRAIDGDPATAWTTDRYRTAAFGNLKDGLGVSFDLGAPAAIGSVVVTAPGAGGVYEVRVSDGPGFEGSTVVATGETGDAASTITPAAPVTSQFVVIWFTTLPEQDGEFRGAVSEVQVQVP